MGEEELIHDMLYILMYEVSSVWFVVCVCVCVDVALTYLHSCETLFHCSPSCHLQLGYEHFDRSSSSSPH